MKIHLLSLRTAACLAACSLASFLSAAAPSDDTATVDLRPAFARWHLEPRAQGGRNTCSVFVVSGALEYALASQRDQGTRLSVEFLNWASNDAIGDNTDGGFFSDLWKGFLKHGICPEADLPYQDRFDPQLNPPPGARDNARKLATTGLQLHWIKPWDVTTGLTDAHLKEIKRVLREKWPVCGGFRWPKAAHWEKDVLQMAPPEGVFDGHSVLLVGFREDLAQSGGGVFLIRNSGGGPRDGFMTYEYAGHYMNDAAWIDHGPAKPTPAVRP